MNYRPLGASHLKSAAMFLLAQFATLAAGLATQYFAARGMIAADYSRFVVAHTILLAATHLLCGALPRISARHVSSFPASMPVVCRSLACWHLPLCGFFSVFLWGVSNVLSEALADPDMAPLLGVVAILIAVHCGVLEPCWNLLNGLRSHRLHAALLGTHGVLRCLAVYFAVASWPCARAAISASLVVAVTSAALALPVVLAKSWRVPAHRITAGVSTGELWDWIRFACLVDAIIFSAATLNLWCVKAYITDTEVVAAYAACFVLSQASISICRVLSRGFSSYFANACNKGGVADCARLLRTASRILIAGAALGVTVAMVAGKAVVGWFSGMAVGNDSLPATLLAGSGILGACYVFSELLAASNHLQARLYAAVLYFFTSSVLGFVGTKIWGADGAAWAFLISGIFPLFLMVATCRRYFGKLHALPVAARCIASSLIALGAAWSLPTGDSAGGAACAALVASVTFISALVVLGELDVDDLLAAWRLPAPDNLRQGD